MVEENLENKYRSEIIIEGNNKQRISNWRKWAYSMKNLGKNFN